jgi:hypothetical protein
VHGVAAGMARGRYVSTEARILGWAAMKSDVEMSKSVGHLAKSALELAVSISSEKRILYEIVWVKCNA